MYETNQKYNRHIELMFMLKPLILGQFLWNRGADQDGHHAIFVECNNLSLL